MKKLQIKKWLLNKHANALMFETVYINKQTDKAIGVGLENGRVLFWLPKSQLMNWDEYSKQLGDKLNSIELICEGVE